MTREFETRGEHPAEPLRAPVKHEDTVARRAVEVVVVRRAERGGLVPARLALDGLAAFQRRARTVQQRRGTDCDHKADHAGMASGPCRVGWTLADLAEKGVGSVLTPQLWAAFVLLAVFPFAVKFLFKRLAPSRPSAEG